MLQKQGNEKFGYFQEPLFCERHVRRFSFYKKIKNKSFIRFLVEKTLLAASFTFRSCIFNFLLYTFLYGRFPMERFTSFNPRITT